MRIPTWIFGEKAAIKYAHIVSVIKDSETCTITINMINDTNADFKYDSEAKMNAEYNRIIGEK